MAEKKELIQPAVKKETKNIILYTAIGTVLMWIVFAVLHFFIAENVPFDYTVILGGLGASLVAVLNFFLMCMTVQTVAATADDKEARNTMKTSYTKRMGLQILWMVVAIAAPCFFWVAGLIPLLFPSLGIKIKGIIDTKRYTPNTNGQEVESKQDEH